MEKYPEIIMKIISLIFSLAEEEKNGEIDPDNSAISLFFTKIEKI